MAAVVNFWIGLAGQALDDQLGQVVLSRLGWDLLATPF
jgi:hypothetical protein